MDLQPFPLGNRWSDLVDYDGDGVELRSPKTKKRKNPKSNNSTTKFPELPNPTPIKNYDIPKYITVKSTDLNNPLSKHSVFAIKKAIDAISTKIEKISMLRDNSLLILTKSKRVAELFIKTKNLGGFCPVEIAYHLNLNFCKATIFDKNLINVSDQEILDDLKNQGVVQIYKFLNKEKQPSGSILLTFDMFEVPKRVDIAWYSVSTREFFPNPMRCRNCQKLGHTQKRCKGNPICQNCNLPDHSEPKTDCSRIMCANCLKEHPSSSTECPSYQMEKKILKIKTINKISMGQARRKYADLVNKQKEEIAKATADTSFSETLKKPSPNSNQTQPLIKKQSPTIQNNSSQLSDNHNTNSTKSINHTQNNEAAADGSPNIFKNFSNSPELLSTLNKYANTKPIINKHLNLLSSESESAMEE